MTLKWGNSIVAAIKWGSNSCNAVYWGGTKVWPDNASFTIIVFREKSYSFTVNSGTIWRTWIGSGRILNTTTLTCSRSGLVSEYIWCSRETESGSTGSGTLRTGSINGSKTLSDSNIVSGTYYANYTQ